MSLKSFGAKLFASVVRKKIDSWAKNPIETQQKVFQELIKNAQNTSFGKDHRFSEIKSHSDFVKNVPVRDWHS